MQENTTIQADTDDLYKLCQQILQTQFFAQTTTLNDLIVFCRQAAEYDEGYFLVPRGWRPWEPWAVSQVWVAVGGCSWVREPCVRLEASDTSGQPELFARALLREIRGRPW